MSRSETPATDAVPSTPVREPYYLPVSDEVEIFTAAYESRIPVLLKGPTGTGKTRFVEHMAWRLGDKGPELPLITVSCHEDLTASDLVGRYLLDATGTRWMDGPLTRAVRRGCICYLDEVMEARADTVVVIHSLTDHRRTLGIDKLGEVLEARDGFLLVVSYNPGYQSAGRELKPSTRQRFVAIEFDYPQPARELRIIRHESGCDEERAGRLAELGARLRNLGALGLGQAVSTRALIHAGRLMRAGVADRRACDTAIAAALGDDAELQEGVREVVRAFFP